MKVLRISHSGVVPAYRERERILARDYKVDLVLAVPRQWPHIGAPNMDQSYADKEAFSIERIPTYLTGNIPLFAYDYLALGSVLQRFQPDLVDIHEEPYAVSGIEIMHLVKSFSPGAKVVFYTAQNINKRYPLPFRIGEQYVYGHAAAAYPCSEGAKQVLIEKGFRKSCSVIPLGVDPNLFSLSCEMAETKKKNIAVERLLKIAYVGRLESCKGLNDLFGACKLLASDMQFELLIAGSGPDKEYLQTQGAKLERLFAITWCGELEQDKMPDFYHNADLVVVPSRTTKSWKEQFGRVPIEAMAASTPVVSSDSGSLKEVVADGGLIYPEGDQTQLAEAMAMVLKDKQLRTKLIERGLELVNTRYSWAKVAQATMHMYENALGQT